MHTQSRPAVGKAILLAILIVVVGITSVGTSAFDYEGGVALQLVELRVLGQDGLLRARPTVRILAGEMEQDASHAVTVVNENSSADGPRFTLEPGAPLLRYGGRARMLFWLIPIGVRTPDVYVEITAPGYTRQKLLWTEVFFLSTEKPVSWRDVSHVPQGDVRVPVYSRIVSLQPTPK